MVGKNCRFCNRFRSALPVPIGKVILMWKSLPYSLLAWTSINFAFTDRLHWPTVSNYSEKEQHIQYYNKIPTSLHDEQATSERRYDQSMCRVLLLAASTVTELLFCWKNANTCTEPPTKCQVKCKKKKKNCLKSIEEIHSRGNRKPRTLSECCNPRKFSRKSRKFKPINQVNVKKYSSALYRNWKNFFITCWGEKRGKTTQSLNHKYAILRFSYRFIILYFIFCCFCSKKKSRK